MIVCAGKSEQFDFAQSIGIGLIESAATLACMLENRKPDHIVFVGTAGSYGEQDIFDIVESSMAANVEQSFFEGKSYTPIENMIISTKKVSRETQEKVINSSNYITTDKRVWKAYTAQNIHLENMEFYAVMKVAQMYGVSAAGIFIVTNYCDENAHEDFQKNHDEAMKRLTAYVKERAKA